MKRKTTTLIVLLGILLLPISQIIAQTASATWNLTSSGNATVSGYVTGGAVSKGVGSRSGGISALSHTSYGVTSTNWTGASSSQFNVMHDSYRNDYYQYTVSPTSGNNFTINSITYEITGSASPVSWFAYYSLDGFNTSTALGARNSLSHTGLNIQVTNGKTLTLRIYGMEMAASTAFRNKFVVISGSTSSCQAQTANAGGSISICKGTTTSPLEGAVGGSATTGIWSSPVGGTFSPSSSYLNARWTPPGDYTGTAILKLTTTNGCSSPAVATKSVTVNNTALVNNPQTICQGGSYTINGHSYTTSGTYTDVFNTQHGCDSTIVTILTVSQPTLNNAVTTSQDGNMLTSGETNASYQWIRCDQGNTAIAGATTQSFSPQHTGTYAVKLTSLGCPNVTLTSECISVNKDNLSVVGNLNVAGTSDFAGEVSVSNKLVLNQIEEVDPLDPQALDSTDVVVRGGDGVLKSFGIEAFANMMYKEKLCFDGSVPVWSNGPNKLYTLCGNVGIGTNSPEYSLHTVGNGYFHTTLRVNGSLAVGTDPISFSRFIIRNNNRDAALQIDQSGNTKNYAKLMFMEYTNPGTEIIKVVNSQTGHTPLLIDVDGNLHLRNGTREIFHVNAGNQTVFARKIVVDEETWPDYVFEKKYDLRPLSEVKTFIEQNGHLPNIPSREKVLEEGVDLGKMVHVLVEKVEELTLYSIQQQEEIEALKKLLEQQQQNGNK